MAASAGVFIPSALVRAPVVAVVEPQRLRQLLDHLAQERPRHQLRRDPRLARPRHLAADAQHQRRVRRRPLPTRMAVRTAAARNQTRQPALLQPPTPLVARRPRDLEDAARLRRREALPHRPSRPPGCAGRRRRLVRTSSLFGLPCLLAHRLPNRRPQGTTLGAATVQKVLSPHRLRAHDRSGLVCSVAMLQYQLVEWCFSLTRHGGSDGPYAKLDDGASRVATAEKVGSLGSWNAWVKL